MQELINSVIDDLTGCSLIARIWWMVFGIWVYTFINFLICMMPKRKVGS